MIFSLSGCIILGIFGHLVKVQPEFIPELGEVARGVHKDTVAFNLFLAAVTYLAIALATCFRIYATRRQQKEAEDFATKTESRKW